MADTFKLFKILLFLKRGGLTAGFQTHNWKIVSSNPTWTISFFKESYPSYIVLRLINKHKNYKIYIQLFVNTYYIVMKQFYYHYKQYIIKIQIQFLLIHL